MDEDRRKESHRTHRTTLVRRGLLPWLAVVAIYPVAAFGESCSDAWYAAPAKAWCWNEGIDTTASGECSLELACGSGSDRTDVTFTGPTSDVKNLRWCPGDADPDDGELVVGTC